MNLTLERFKSTGDATMGRLSIDGESFCYTLEDEHRDEKVAGETRIPAGKYRILLRNAGGMVGAYNERYADVGHRGMLHLQDVPDFEWIYIHTGNTDEHSAGCILVGYSKDEDRMTIGRSRDAYSALYERVAAAAEAGTLTITIEDHDRAAVEAEAGTL